MATTVHEPPKIEDRRDPSRLADNSGIGGRNLVPASGDLRRVKDYSPPPSSTGIWVVLASITMSFAAFTSALIVRQGAGTDWRHLTLPPILYLNTLVLLASSVTLEVARRRVGAFMGGRGDQVANPARWLYITLCLGLLFVAGQYAAWIQLRAQGVFLATNPNSSFFYVLTAVHAVHVSGGLGGLARVIRRLHKSILRKSTLRRHLALLAFHGRSLGVFACLAVGKAVTSSTGGNTVSHADMTMGGHSAVMERPAFSVPAKKMAMWLFIIADTATFAGCLVAYGFLRNATPNWPRPFHSITNVAIMTFILVTSSLTMLFAIEAAKAGDKAKAFNWTLITAAGGALFALVAHPRMDGIDRGGHDPAQESVGHRAVWRRVFQHHRLASPARDLRRDRAGGGRDPLSRRPLQRGRSGDYRPVLAFRRSGLDVRGSTGLSAEPESLRKRGSKLYGYGRSTQERVREDIWWCTFAFLPSRRCSL